MSDSTRHQNTDIVGLDSWKLKKVDDCIELIYGKSLPERKRIREGIPVFGSNGIVGFHNSALVKGPGVVIGRKGSVGEVNFSKTDFFPIDTTYYVKPKPQNDLLFWYYFLLTLKLKELNSHSAVPGLNRDVVYFIERRIPPYIEQHEIARILSAFDAKIELNTQMNATLEAIGQALFKRWFVDFEFPDEHGRPYKSSGGKMIESEMGEIPEGWSYSSIGEHLSLLKDGSHNPPKRVASGIRFIAGASDVKDFSVDFTGCTYISQEEYQKIHKFWSPKVRDVLLTIVGTVGNVAIVQKNDLPFSLQRSIAVLRSDKLPLSFIYLLLKGRYFQTEIKKRMNTTAQPGIYLGSISQIKIIVPDKEIITSFDITLRNIIENMQSNVGESRDLMTLRDGLLPRLMSGKIRVPA